MKNDGRWNAVMGSLDEMNLDWECSLSFTRTIANIKYKIVIEDRPKFWLVKAIFPITVSNDDEAWYLCRLRNITEDSGYGVFELNTRGMPQLRVTCLHDRDNTPISQGEVDHILAQTFKLLEKHGAEVMTPPYRFADWMRDKCSSLTSWLRGNEDSDEEDGGDCPSSEDVMSRRERSD